jgi:hypothetical protein
MMDIMIQEGNLLTEYRDKWAEASVKESGFETDFEGYKIFVFKRNKEGNIVYVGMAKGAVKRNKLKKYVLHVKPYNVELGETKDNQDELDLPAIPNESAGGEVLFLEKLGKRKYNILRPISLGEQIKAQVTEEDIAEAVRTYDINAKYYTAQDWKMWIAPAIFIIMAVLIVIMLAIVMSHFDVLKEVSANLIEVARTIKQGAIGNSGVPAG